MMQLITQVTSLDICSMLPKSFPRSGFFNFGNKSKSGGLMSGLYVGGSTCHPYFSKISDTAPEAWGRVLSCKMRTPAANVVDLSWWIFCSCNFPLVIPPFSPTSLGSNLYLLDCLLRYHCFGFHARNIQILFQFFLKSMWLHLISCHGDRRTWNRQRVARFAFYIEDCCFTCPRSGQHPI